MNPKLLLRIARCLATHLGSDEEEILQRIEGDTGLLGALLSEKKVSHETQEDMLCYCLGFTRRAALPKDLGKPVLPDQPEELHQILGRHAVLLFRPPGTRPVLAASDPAFHDLKDQVSLLLGTVVDMLFLPAAELDAGRASLGLTRQAPRTRPSLAARVERRREADDVPPGATPRAGAGPTREGTGPADAGQERTAAAGPGSASGGAGASSSDQEASGAPLRGPRIHPSANPFKSVSLTAPEARPPAGVSIFDRSAAVSVNGSPSTRAAAAALADAVTDESARPAAGAPSSVPSSAPSLSLSAPAPLPERRPAQDTAGAAATQADAPPPRSITTLAGAAALAGGAGSVGSDVDPTAAAGASLQGASSKAEPAVSAPEPSSTPVSASSPATAWAPGATAGGLAASSPVPAAPAAPEAAPAGASASASATGGAFPRLPTFDSGPVVSPPDTPAQAADVDPVVSAVDQLIRNAVTGRATDVHLEPAAGVLTVKHRIDGVLVAAGSYASSIAPLMVARLKHVSGMETKEGATPRDGRFQVVVDGRAVDLHVSSVTGEEGEMIIIGIRLRPISKIDLRKAGFRPEMLVAFRRVFNVPSGMVLVTGPPESGSDATLYGMVQDLKMQRRRIVTVEDPILESLEGVTQIPVAGSSGLSFPGAVEVARSLEPEVLMVGDIRDSATAQAAVQAAIKGTLVLGGLHSPTPLGALRALFHLDVDTLALKVALQGVLAQRLVGKLCLFCRRPLHVDEAIKQMFAEQKVSVSPRIMGVGACGRCHRTGFSGKIGIHELLPISDALRALIDRKASDEEFKALMAGERRTSMLADGLAKVADGDCTLEDVCEALGMGVSAASRSIPEASH